MRENYQGTLSNVNLKTKKEGRSKLTWIDDNKNMVQKAEIGRLGRQRQLQIKILRIWYRRRKNGNILQPPKQNKSLLIIM